MKLPTVHFVLFLEWDTKEEDQSDVNVWEDNWDDDTVEDDFSVQLRLVSFASTVSLTLSCLSALLIALFVIRGSGMDISLNHFVQ